MAQTRRDIQATLEAAGISPLKRFGQNFLIDANLMRKLVAAAEIQPTDVVLEVGPGTGGLTDFLVEAAGHVVAVEIDRGLQAICGGRFSGRANFTLIAGDVLAGKSRITPQILSELQSRQQQSGGRILLVANLPYQVATPLFMELVMGVLPVTPMCFTVQAEVGERILASAGSKEYGPVSILAQALGTVRRIVRVPPEAFWPAPKVHSVMLKWERDPKRALGAAQQASMARTVHHCFNYRRKTLRSSLRTLLTVTAREQLEASGRWNLDARPEQLSPAQWVELARAVEGLSDPHPP